MHHVWSMSGNDLISDLYAGTYEQCLYMLRCMRDSGSDLEYLTIINPEGRHSSWVLR